MIDHHLSIVEGALGMLDEQVGVPEQPHMPQNTNQGIIYAIKELHSAVSLLKAEVRELQGH